MISSVYICKNCSRYHLLLNQILYLRRCVSIKNVFQSLLLSVSMTTADHVAPATTKETAIVTVESARPPAPLLDMEGPSTVVTLNTTKVRKIDILYMR